MTWLWSIGIILLWASLATLTVWASRRAKHEEDESCLGS